MNKPCYCCEPTDNSRESLPDLDVALNELGMLSVTTEVLKVSEPGQKRLVDVMGKRSDGFRLLGGYKKIREEGVCFLRMERKYVTNIVTSAADKTEGSNSLQDAVGASSQAGSSSELQFLYESPDVCQNQKHSLKIRPSRTKLRFLKPYEVPWQHQLEERVRTLSWNNETEAVVPPVPAAATPTLTAVADDTAACNRSNPSSPAKVARPTTSSGLLRSRSLDDLVCAVWDKSEDAILKKEEIETVSQQMMDLKVN